MSGSDQNHWKHTWPCAQVLANYLCSEPEIVKDKVVLEIGAGATGVCGLTTAKLGAERVFLTDHPDLHTALETLQQNIESNGISEKCVVTGLDWDDRSSVTRVIDLIGNRLDVIIASDVFFDPSTFSGLIDTFAQLLTKFERTKVWFAYQQRDDNWTCAPQLAKYPFLKTSLVKRLETDKETIDIFTMTSTKGDAKGLYAGIEGGGTGSKLVIIDWETNRRFCSSNEATNFFLTDHTVVCKRIADWITDVFEKEGLKLEDLRALGLGLSGAEDEEFNKTFTDYFRKNFGHITENFYLTSDSVMTLLANFPMEENGIVLIAGTGSSCRMKKRDGEVKGVGGWGHMIGDGGSAFWIARSAIQMLFDVEDEFYTSFNTNVIKRLLLEHFGITEKTQILSFLYSNFKKNEIASFTMTLSRESNDPAIANIFRSAGHILGRHVATVARHLNEEERESLNIVQIGGVFQSWSALENGFISAVKGSGIRRIRMFEPSDSPAVGAAVLAAKEKYGIYLQQSDSKKFLRELVIPDL